MPKAAHENYRNLQPREKVLVSKLAALLRVADAMDHDHSGRVQGCTVQYKRPNFSVKMTGQGDLLLERWALLKKCDMFEKVYKVKFGVKS
jgi:exopolyphosphatase/guanosine-5'-triphosphate,3'-diphosphate pyrophosphatase